MIAKKLGFIIGILIAFPIGWYLRMKKAFGYKVTKCCKDPVLLKNITDGGTVVIFCISCSTIVHESKVVK